jgi:transcriptional regulator with XRE-family HTH domain
MAPATTIEMLLRALRADKRPLLQIAQAAGLFYPTIYNFAKGKRGLSLASAEKLAPVLGLELRLRKGQVEHGKSGKRPRRP